MTRAEIIMTDYSEARTFDNAADCIDRIETQAVQSAINYVVLSTTEEEEYRALKLGAARILNRMNEECFYSLDIELWEPNNNEAPINWTKITMQ